MNGMTGGVEVFWTLLICNYIKFNHIPRDVELVIFHWLSCCFFLGCWYWSWGSQFPIPPSSKGLCSGPIDLPTATSCEGESYPSIICIAWCSWPGCHIWYVWISQMLVGFYMRSFVFVLIFLTRAMLFVFPFGKHDSGTQTMYLAVWVY